MWIKVIKTFFKKGIEHKKELDLIKKEKKYNGKVYLFNKRVGNHFLVTQTDYATVRILRKKGLKPPLFCVSALLIYKGEILLHKRDLNLDTYPGYYHIFGGVVEEENIFQALKREILEESGLFVFNCKDIGLYKEETGIVSVLFRCFAKGKIKASEGEVEFFEPFKDYKLTPMAEYLLKFNSPYCKEKDHNFSNI